MLSEKQTAQPFSERFYDNQPLIDRLRERNTHIDDQLVELKQKIGRVNKKRKPLTKTQELKDYNDVTVTRLLAKRFSVSFNEQNYSKCIHDIQVATLALSAMFMVTGFAWLIISNANFVEDSNFSYNGGLLGGFLMLCSVFYALLKRIKFVYAMGHNETWFYAHLICGIGGTMLVIFHTMFQIKSFNSGVALFCLTLVIISGIFGRYICSLLSFKVQQFYDRIGLMELEIINSLARHHRQTGKAVKASMTRLLVTGMGKNKTWKRKCVDVCRLPWQSVSFYFKLKNDLKQTYKNIAQASSWNDHELKLNIKDSVSLARRYVTNIFLLCITQVTADILTHWRTIHSSILYLLVFTASGHIVAVHMY